MNIQQNKVLYISLRNQYINGRPMNKSEEEKMWDCWHKLTASGWKWLKIKDSQIRTDIN